MADAFQSASQTPRGLALVALIMVAAGLGFRIAAVPFHFYAPDVYRGTLDLAHGRAARFCAEDRRVRTRWSACSGFVEARGHNSHRSAYIIYGLQRDLEMGQLLGEQVPVLLWIMAAVTMSLGNILALLQDNVKRLLAYSSVAHAGYMLVGLAVAPKLMAAGSGTVGGVEALLFYLVAYGGMTVGAFGVLHYLSTKARPVETVDDLAGLSRSHPKTAAQ